MVGSVVIGLPPFQKTMIISMNLIEHLGAPLLVLAQWLCGAIAVVFMAKLMVASVATQCSNCQLLGVLYGPMGENTLGKPSKNALFYRLRG